MNTRSKHAILIGAGELDCAVAAVIKNNISADDFVIALDGGLMFCEEHDIKPDMIVGDFDSLHTMQHQQESTRANQEILTQYPQDIIYPLPCEKDDTDTLAAIKIAIEKDFERFTIYGGLGGRLSHTMANIQTLMYLKEQGLYGELIGDKCRIFMIKDESITLQPYHSGYVSVFSYSEKAQGVTLKNLKYEVEKVELTNAFPIGVSNEFVGKTAEISVEKGVLLIVLEF